MREVVVEESVEGRERGKVGLVDTVFINQVVTHGSMDVLFGKVKRQVDDVRPCRVIISIGREK